MMGYPIERLLRHPVEVYSSAVSMSTALLLATSPHLLMITPSVAYWSAGLLSLGGGVRFMQGMRIIRYQNGLRRLPYFAMKPDEIPVSRKKLYLGMGYRWLQPHVQRLRDIRLAGVQHYVEPGQLYTWVRQKEVEWETRPLMKHLIPLTGSHGRLNPVRPYPAVGGKPEIHAVGLLEKEKPVFMDLGERVGHTLILGTTRVGKTRLAEIFITQDIRRGDVTIVFDPKGDADLMSRCYVEAKRAKRRCYIMHLGHPKHSARYNILGNFERITEIAGRVSDQLPSEGNSAAFKEFGWRFINIVAGAMVALGDRPDANKIRRYIQNIEPLLVLYIHYYLLEHGEPGWGGAIDTLINDTALTKGLDPSLRGRSAESIAAYKYITAQSFDDSILDGLISAFRYDRTYFDKIVSSLGPLLEKLTSGTSAQLTSPDYFDLDDPRPIFDFMSAIQQNAVVYIGLDALSDATVAGAVGASMFADLTSIAGRIYKHGLDRGLPQPADGKKRSRMPRVAIHADEFSELVGDQFIPMVNKAGGAGFQVNAYTQTSSDILAGIGDAAKAGQIQGNFNTLIMLRVKSTETAEFLTQQLPTVQVSQLTSISGYSDNSDPDNDTHFSSRVEDRATTQDVPMLETADIVALPKGQAFVLTEGAKLYKVRFPLPEADDDLPESLAEIAQDMKNSYSRVTPENWYKPHDNWYQFSPVPSGDLSTDSVASRSEGVTQ
ncbi:MAG: type IV conjugative transfer system coupling protein TraD [Pseudomonadota bacterium]|nr:type IV conjugative transfer system coupling protein TraD [Pseudomonadota bacterium]